MNSQFQSNKARLIYKLSKTPTPKSIQLKNGLFLSKEENSDEKLIYPEKSIENLIKTTMFMFLFNYFPVDSIENILNTNTSIFSSINYDIPKLYISEFKNLIDAIYGKKFSHVCSRPLMKVYKEYRQNWFLAKYGKIIKTPSISDFIDLFNFINTSNTNYTKTVKFFLDNSKDFKYKYQQIIN